MTGHLADRFNFESGTNCSTQTTPNRDCDIQSPALSKGTGRSDVQFYIVGEGGGGGG